MATQSVASRSRRPADADDVVVGRALEVADWARKNARAIVIAVVALFVLVGGLLFLRILRAQNLERAATAYLQLQQQVAVNPQGATQALSAFVQAHDGTPYADEARLHLAAQHLQAGQPRQAIPVLQPLAAELGDSPLAGQAGLLLATAQSAAGDRNAALQTYLRVADQAELGFQKQEALANAALLREEANDFAGAAELYARLAEEAPEGSLERSVFEMRRAEAAARAAAR